jgi:hypothetical protein
MNADFYDFKSMAFHAGLVLIHRPSLADKAKMADLAIRRCRESATIIVRLIHKYLEIYGDPKKNASIDFMIPYSAFTASVVHMVMLLDPDAITYRSSLRVLKTVVKALWTMLPSSEYTYTVYKELQDLALHWNISPANSYQFWQVEQTVLTL